MTEDDYLNLITPYHRSKPKFSAMIAAIVAPFILAQERIAGLIADFDIDSAIGVQLDAVGEWVGLSRYIVTPLENVWFSLGIEGLGLGQAPILGPYDSDTGLTTLDDNLYRKLLKARIAINNWDGTVPAAQAALDIFFDDPDSLVFYDDRGDMTASIAISQKIPAILLLVILAGGYLPVEPGGVEVDYLVTSVDGAPCFGLGANNEFIGGLGFGAMANPIADRLTL